MPPLERTNQSFEKHRFDQLLYIARHTTFEQRFQWLEDSIELFRTQLKLNWEKEEQLSQKTETSNQTKGNFYGR